MKPLSTLSAAALLISLSVGGVGCSSNQQAAQDRDHGYTGNMAYGETDTGNQQTAGFQQGTTVPANQAGRGDVGNGAFGETPP